MNTIDMKNIGLTEQLIEASKSYKDGYIGRVSSQSKHLYKVIVEEGEMTAKISGKFRHQANDLSEFPSVGDFVMVDRMDNTQGNGIIHHVLPRKSVFMRKAAGSNQDTQVVAANIDTVLICMALNHDFNLRRLERYLSIAWDSGATPVIVLTKSDLCDDIDSKLSDIASIAIGVDVLMTSTASGAGFESVKKFLYGGQTVVLMGSSGVGKSTLINHLLGQPLLATNETRNDDKGRHTTTRRELLILPGQGVVIDTPGMRELGIIHADLARSFADIEELAAGCRFNNCTHQQEPNCAVQQAIKTGSLSAERMASYRKLEKETKYDGLHSRMIEKEKIHDMFHGVGGMKNARKFIKEQNRKKGR